VEAETRELIIAKAVKMVIDKEGIQKMSKRIVAVIIFFYLISINAEYKEVSWDLNYDTYIIIRNYPKKLKLSMLTTTLKRTTVFKIETEKNKIYENGYVGVSESEEKTILTVNNQKNNKGVKGGARHYVLGISGSKCYLCDEDNVWSELTFSFINEKPYPGGHPDYERIWIINIKSKYFEGDYVLQIDNEDFYVK